MPILVIPKPQRGAYSATVERRRGASMPRATEPGAAPTRERILDQAERLIAARGVYGFTLRDIAAPLRMRAPAIYKHYKSRDDVLIGVSRRFIALLAAQFDFKADSRPSEALRAALNEFVRMMIDHPAYVRLSLVDFATPGGGMEYVKLAAGGSFQENFTDAAPAPESSGGWTPPMSIAC